MSSRTDSLADRSAPMVGSATLTMKKSMRGSAAASSTVKSPRPLSSGGAAARTGRGVVVSVVTATSLRLPPEGSQSLLILVEEPPGNRVRVEAGWRHGHHGPGDSRTGDRVPLVPLVDPAP